MWHLVTSTFHFAWQAWHLRHWAGSGGALGLQVGRDAAPLCVAGLGDIDVSTLRGRCGTWRHPPSLCVAGVALMALGWLWWRDWAHFGRPGRRATLHGRRGTWRRDIHLHFAWQAWRLVTSTFTLRGRRGTCGTGLGSGGVLGRDWARLGAVSRR